jgi:ferric-dicitrate binding protein FerR (iron transport regulator)
MRDDYLWDKKGEPDRDVEELERALGQFRQAVPPPDFQAVPVEAAPFPSRRTPRWLALAAAIGLVGFLAGWIASRPERPTVRVASLAGAPRIGSTSIAASGRLRTGQDLVTDAASRARIDMGLIGEVEVEPLSRVGLVEASPTEHRLTLRVGTLHARIWAPPRLFFVDTPSATAVDLGCAYTLTVDAAGASRLNVTTGWVAFEFEGRESFVPEGAMCLTRPGIGPGTPYRTDAPAALREALDRLDFQEDPSALDSVLTTSGKNDTLTLWHLLGRTLPEQRGLVYDRLAALLPPPAGVTREGIVSGDRAMRDRWWDELGLGSTSWWRQWKGPSPVAR